MGSIVYRIVFPGIVLAIIFVGIASYYFYKYKNNMNMNKNFFIVFCVIISLMGLLLSVFYSFDLIYKDYIVVEAEFINYHRERDEYELLFIDKNGNDVRCFMPLVEMKKYDFDKESNYKITYAKRTGMLLDARETGDG